jgi:hypothetical protein
VPGLQHDQKWQNLLLKKWAFFTIPADIVYRQLLLDAQTEAVLKNHDINFYK